VTQDRPLASLSLDLDNLWSYLKTRGDPAWQALPSYLDLVVPRFLELLAAKGLRMTVFVVGQDAARPDARATLRALVEAGHEIGNHSFHHEPWLHRYSAAEVEAEIARAEEAILAATGVRPRGFRGPGYSLSTDVLETLQRRGYAYDASTFPTFLGPLARAYYFARAQLNSRQKAERAVLFGGLADGLRPVGPYRWGLAGGHLLEVPVTTMPGLKLPFHPSYVLWLAGTSERLARAYFLSALTLCQAAGVGPSLLLHPLDILGGDEVPALRFFPAMDQPANVKRRRLARLIDLFATRFDVRPLGEHAAALDRRADLPLRTPHLATAARCPPPGAGEVSRARRV
jgi:hypothetical protein